MRGGSFVDTNIWVYAHLRAPGEPRHGRALALVENLANGVISAQVASEYYSVMLRWKPDVTLCIPRTYSTVR